MTKALPEFGEVHLDFAKSYISRVLSHGQDETYMQDLVIYPDNHFRVIFDPNYFTLAEDRDEPSKSQWNTLKKRMKRIEKNVFVFKEYGAINTAEGERYYLDFGFFADDD